MIFLPWWQVGTGWGSRTSTTPFGRQQGTISQLGVADEHIPARSRKLQSSRRCSEPPALSILVLRCCRQVELTNGWLRDPAGIQTSSRLLTCVGLRAPVAEMPHVRENRWFLHLRLV